MSMPPPTHEPFRPVTRPLRGMGPGQVFSAPVLGKALAASIGLHGALVLGGLAWLGMALLGGPDLRVPPEISVESRIAVVPVAEPRPPLEFEVAEIPEPELRPVFEEDEEVFPVDWMLRHPAHPRRADLYAVVRPVEPDADPPEVVEPVPPPEEPAAAEPESATVTASTASQVEASYDPDPALSPPPRYPGIAISRGWEGTVVLTATVSADGRLLDLVVTRSSGRGILDGAALEAVRNWAPGAFRPAMRDGLPVDGQVPIQFRFQIEGGRGGR